jgi:hypothetical protein
MSSGSLFPDELYVTAVGKFAEKIAKLMFVTFG